MAQVVKVKVRDPGLTTRHSESLLHIHQTFTRSPFSNSPRGEHEIALVSLALLYQKFSHALTHWDNPITCGLCIDHVNNATQKIDVPPRKIQQLAATHSGTERQSN
jgi:hypothetical protein